MKIFSTNNTKKDFSLSFCPQTSVWGSEQTSVWGTQKGGWV